MKICRIDDCPNQAKSLGLCIKHYSRLRQNGDPLRLVGRGRKFEPPPPDRLPIIDGDIAHLPLTSGYTAIIDASDVPRISQYRWNARVCANGVAYAQCKSVGQLHRWLLQVSPDMLGDHINGDTLDNRRANLRIVNHQQSIWNRRPRGRFVGITHAKGRWISQIMHNRKNYILGTFDTPEEAARRYDQEALRIRGKFAILNFPNG